MRTGRPRRATWTAIERTAFEATRRRSWHDALRHARAPEAVRVEPARPGPADVAGPGVLVRVVVVAAADLAAPGLGAQVGAVGARADVTRVPVHVRLPHVPGQIELT